MWGVCFVLQPWTDGFQPTIQVILLGYGISVAQGLFVMTDMIILSHFSCLEQLENQKPVIFWMSLLGTGFSLGISLVIEKLVIPLTLTDWLLVFGHCGTYAVIIPLNMYVCARLPGIALSLIMGTSVIHMLIAQYMELLGIQRGNHNVLELCGVGIVLFSSVFPHVVKYLKDRKGYDNLRERS